MKKEIIKDAITSDSLYDYLTADYGSFLGVYADGSVSVGQSVGQEILESERPISVVKCPGIGNLDSTFWTDDWAEGNEDGTFTCTVTGENLTLSQCIYLCCIEGDVSADIAELVELLIDSIV